MFHQSFRDSINMKPSTFLLLILLPVLSQGWEVAVATENGLKFVESNGTLSSRGATGDSLDGRSFVALAVDPSNKRIFLSVASPEKGNAIVLGISVNSNDSDPVPIVRSEVGSDDVQGLAYDEVGKSLYWTVSNRHAILWANLSEGTVVRGGNVLHQLEESEDPLGIAVDGCRRFVFWTNSHHQSPSIERSNLDGTSRVTIVATGLFKPLALALDPSGSGRIFWTDNSEGIHYKIEMSRLDGTERTIVVHGQHHQPYALAFSSAYGKDGSAALFWSDWTHDAVWQISLEDRYILPKQIFRFKDTSPMGLIAAAALHKNHSLNGTDNVVCPVEEAQTTTTTTETPKPAAIMQPITKMVNDLSSGDNAPNAIRSRVYPDYCINGEPMAATGRNGGIRCKCRSGFSGQRCENSMCYNYCIHGSCRVERRLDGEWEPKCDCRTGFSGRRCEYDPCRGYCLNGGRCRIEDGGSPRCTCPGSGQHVLGERCERRLGLLEKMCVVRCSQGGGKAAGFIPLESVNGEQDTEGPLCMCPSNPGKYVYFNNSPRANLSATGDREKSFESSDSPFVLVLGVMCVALLAVSLYLAFKVCSLRRLPRIKKRIIVSKGSVPLAAGCGGRGGTGSPGNQVMGEQQQCEITIENCCNMNICETPCFEPQLRSPGNSAVSNKSGKEEKKMLLANMEVPKSNCGPCQGADELY